MKVHTVTRTKGGSKQYLCTACHEPILPGQKYHHWTPYRSTTRQRHVSCGYPRPTELSNSKIAVVDEAVQDLDLSGNVEDMKAALEGLASTAEEVASEYNDSADGIESHFPSGNPTSEACRNVAEALESWAQELQSWDPDDREEDDDEDDYLDACRESAQELVGNKPEYEG